MARAPHDTPFSLLRLRAATLARARYNSADCAPVSVCVASNGDLFPRVCLQDSPRLAKFMAGSDRNVFAETGQLKIENQPQSKRRKLKFAMSATTSTLVPSFVTEIFELEMASTPLASHQEDGAEQQSHLVLLRSQSHTYTLDLKRRRLAELNPFAIGTQILMCFLVGLVCFLAISANLIVCYIVLSDKRKRTPVNLFIVNLAVSDTLMAALFIPGFFFPIRILRYWPFSLFLCKIFTYSFASSMLIGVYTTIVISLEKYRAVVHLRTETMSTTRAKLIIIAIWFAALITSAPIAIVAKLEEGLRIEITKQIQFLGAKSCKRVWEDFWRKGRDYYTIAFMILRFFLPMLILLVTYTRIAYCFWFSRTPGEPDAVRDARIRRNKRKTLKMTIFLLSAFALAWLPATVLKCVALIYPSLDDNQYMEHIDFVVTLLTMCHTFTNPLVYIWMEKDFLNGFKQVAGSMCNAARRSLGCLCGAYCFYSSLYPNLSFRKKRRKLELKMCCGESQSKTLTANRSNNNNNINKEKQFCDERFNNVELRTRGGAATRLRRPSGETLARRFSQSRKLSV